MASEQDFVQQAQVWLRLIDEGDTDPIDADALRGWLSQMPQRLSETSIEVWTLLMGGLIWVTGSEQPAKEQDCLLLKQVLDHALTVPMHEWLAEQSTSRENGAEDDYTEKRPAYDALRWLMFMLANGYRDEGPATVFVEVLQHHWEPGPLLWHLDQAREIQALYMDDDRSPGCSTAQNLLIQAVLSAMGTTPWRPQNHPVWELLWQRGIHTYYHDEAHYESGPPPRQSEKRNAAAAAYQLFPEHTALMLSSYFQWKDLRRHLPPEKLFPLALQQDDDDKLLRALLYSRYQQHNTHNGGIAFNRALVQHHPEVVHLLDMHNSFYAQPHQAMNAIGDAAPAFHRLLEQRTVELLPLPDLDADS